MPPKSSFEKDTPLHIRAVLAVHRPLDAFTSHPAVNIFVGLGLLTIGIDELVEAIFPDYDSFFQVHHAVILIGLVTFLHGLIGLGERLEAALKKG
jgi:hypothetical protein